MILPHTCCLYEVSIYIIFFNFFVEFCIKGKEYNSSIDQCVSCAVGYFKDTIGNDPCKPCWTNLTTTDVGSTDVSQCSISKSVLC